MIATGEMVSRSTSLKSADASLEVSSDQCRINAPGGADMAPPHTLENGRKVTSAKTQDSGLVNDIESYEVHFCAPDVRKIREFVGMTQSAFASNFGISIATLRNWEQGRSEPDASMRSYLSVIKNKPNMVMCALEEERRKRRVDVVSH